MKSFNSLTAFVIIIILLIFAGTNLMIYSFNSDDNRGYRVEIQRCADEIERVGRVDLEKYPSLISVEKSPSPEKEFLEGGNYDYIIREINGEFYRFDYVKTTELNKKSVYLRANIILGILSVFIISILIYIGWKILKPFNELSEIPYEIAKGNLTLPLKENKSKYFGKFIWGLDMLREQTENSKKKELQLQKQRKTFLLSISHDIKTPLSAIKLSSKALSKNLYPDRLKQIEVAESINRNADDIQRLLDDVMEGLREDFINFEVSEGEFYIADLVKSIENHYKNRLNNLHIGFNIDDFTDSLVKGDLERSVEVLQNVIENAVKYGMGSDISLHFSEEEDFKAISVSNKNCRLTASEMPYIFNSFWRGGNSSSCEGQGLGLYICRELMHRMNGEAYAELKDEVITVNLLFRKA